MANVLHSAVAGADLHEPKGVASATANQVYVADGAGSGAWFTLRFVGEIVEFFGTTEPTGFLFCDGDTIGNASSNGTARANADTEDLFTQLWTMGNTHGSLAIFTSAGASSTYGASAAADYAANKAIALPDKRERVTVGYDNKGSGTVIGASYLDTTVLGDTGGIDDYVLLEANIPEHSHTFSGTTSTTGDHTHTGTTDNDTHNHDTQEYAQLRDSIAGGGANDNMWQGTDSDGFTSMENDTHNHSLNINSAGDHAHTYSDTTSNYGQASPTALENIQPSIVCTYLIFYGA